MKNLIRKIMAIPSKIYNYVILNYYHVTHLDSLHINGKIGCVANSKNGISFGKNVKINSGPNTNPIGGDTRTFLFAKGKGQIIIGNNVGISNSTIFATSKIVIEDNVIIGGSCKIYDTDFHPLEYEARMTNSDANKKDVLIKEGAFIGAHTIILKGVTIGKRSVIGAGSVVTKNVPDNEIWGGNPAHFLKHINEVVETEKN